MKIVPRKKSGPQRKKHPIICSRCGAEDTVDFIPKGIAPLLCRRCHRKKVREEKKRKRSVISRSS